MNLIQSSALIVHVLTGLIGIIAAYTILIELLRREPVIKKVLTSSLVSVVAYVLSWVSGGYYYLTFYGAQVKPLILKGPYPWAHSIFTEAKEHVFLFLPFIALVTWLVVRAHKTTLNQQPQLKKSVIWLTAVQVLIGVFVTISGFIMSGSVRLD